MYYRQVECEMSMRRMRKSERIEFRGNLWANTWYFLTKAASELWRINPPKSKSPSVVGFSRLTLLDCLTTWVYLDNTRTRMRVLFYMVICASFYLDFRIFKVRSLRSRGGEIPEFASRVWACFDYQNNSQHIHTAPCGATSAFADAFYVHYSRMLFGYSCEKHPFF